MLRWRQHPRRCSGIEVCLVAIDVILHSEITAPFCCHLKLQDVIIITGQPNGPVLFCSLMSVVVVCCHLSGSVTLHVGPAGGFTRTGQVMTSCRRLQSNYSSTVTLYGGPVVLRPVWATPCFILQCAMALPFAFRITDNYTVQHGCKFSIAGQMWARGKPLFPLSLSHFLLYLLVSFNYCLYAFYPHVPVGKVWIIRLLFVFVILC